VRVRLAGVGHSTIDIVGDVSLVVWLCGCNLRCPFCHNWKIARNDPALCREVEIERVLERLESARGLADSVLVTGGEPLLQPEATAAILSKASELGMRPVLESNLTIPEALRTVLDLAFVNEIVTDIKVPPEAMMGLSPEVARRAWSSFLESLRIAVERVPRVTLRLPIYPGELRRRDTYLARIGRYLEQVRSIVEPRLESGECRVEIVAVETEMVETPVPPAELQRIIETSLGLTEGSRHEDRGRRH